MKTVIILLLTLIHAGCACKLGRGPIICGMDLGRVVYTGYDNRYYQEIYVKKTWKTTVWYKENEAIRIAYRKLHDEKLDINKRELKKLLGRHAKWEYWETPVRKKGVKNTLFFKCPREDLKAEYDEIQKILYLGKTGRL